MTANSSRRIFALIIFSIPLITNANSISSVWLNQHQKDSPKEALLKALRAKQSATSYRCTYNQTDTANQNFTVDAEYVAPDKYHIIGNSNLAQKGKGPDGLADYISSASNYTITD